MFVKIYNYGIIIISILKLMINVHIQVRMNIDTISEMALILSK